MERQTGRFSVGIIGCGVVGSAVYRFLQKRKPAVRLVLYDKDLEAVGNLLSATQTRTQTSWVTHATSIASLVEKTDIVFVCVPTPEDKETGACDTSLVRSVVREITEAEAEAEAESRTQTTVVIKSTVPPGTTDSLGRQCVFSLENLRETSYYSSCSSSGQDMQHDFHVFAGGSREDRRACVDLYTPISGPECKYIQLESATRGELAKYALNTFFACKLAFFYDFSRICDLYDEDYSSIRELFLCDKRINANHTVVYSPRDQKKAFSGKCLPKDTRALIHACIQEGHTPKMLEAAMQINESLEEE
jgi:UDPglucose 6-dehydrogenase